MRVEVGRQVRVSPGDIIVIRGCLAPDSKLSRLYVFAKEGDVQFSPYVEGLHEKLMVSGERPQMYTPLSMRLDGHRPQHEISFVADIDGWIRIMQEVDRAHDSKAVVRIKRTVNPSLPWWQRLRRLLSGKLGGILSWSH
jgi:hypothetical protein